jgi:hypothetical protein
MSNYSTYTTDYPQHVAPNNFTVFSTAQTTATTTQSLRRIVSTRGGQRFGLRFNYAPMTRDKFMPLWAFLVKQAGQYGTFSIALPNQECRGSLSKPNASTLQTNQATSGNSVQVKNFNANQTNVVRAGDYFRFLGRTKLYIATADVNSDGTGLATIPCYPNIDVTIAQDIEVVFEPVMNVGLVKDDINVDIPNDMTYNFSVEFIERIG